MGKKVPKRRTWRKANIKDVEDALEDERLVNKMKRSALKGPKGKGDAEELVPELFTVDTAGSCQGLSRASRREIARAKIFPPKAPRLQLSASEELKVARAEQSLEVARSAKRRRGGTSGQEVFDLWAAPLPTDALKEARSEASLVRRTAMQVPLSTPKTLHKKVSAAPAVVPAHEGQSMNPEAVAYEELACRAAAQELEKEREAEATERKLRPITCELRDALGAEAVKDMDDAAKVLAARELMCPGSTVAGEEGTDDAPAESSRSKKMRIKSQAHRNREQLRKDLNTLEAQRRTQKKLEKSVGEVGAILKQMKEEEKWREERKAYRTEMRAKKRHLEETEGVVPAGRRIGKARVTDEAIVVPDSEAAGKGLRSMPLRGATAVKERMASIVRRGLLPAAPEAARSEVIRHKRKAAKVKRSRKFMSPLLRDNLLLR